MRFAIMLQIIANEDRQHNCGIYTFSVGLREIGWTIIFGHALHLAGLFRIAASAFEQSSGTGKTQHQRKMTAC